MRMTTVPMGSTEFHDASRLHGLQVSCLRAHGERSFSRLSTTDAELTDNVAWLAGKIGKPIALPRAFDDKAPRPIHHMRGSGFTADTNRNPNPAGLGLVRWLHEEQDAALAVTWADAPVVFAIHLPTGAHVAFSNGWRAPNVARQAIDRLESLVNRQKVPFSPDDVWALLTPGASTLKLRIKPEDAERFRDVLDFATPAGTELPEVEGRKVIDQFNLPSFTAHQLIRVGVASEHIELDPLDTMNPENDLPSKRKCDAAGKPYPSGIATIACQNSK